jgi:hypothetical protein
MDHEEQPSRVSEAAQAYRVSSIVTPSLRHEQPSSSVAEAFELVPAEFRGNLAEYFGTAEGRRVLPIFLNKMSAWWFKDTQMVLPDITQAIGLLEGDPVLDQLTESIQKKRRRYNPVS